MNKNDLRELFEHARIGNFKYIALEIQQDGVHDNEVIIIHQNNFERKWEYIDNAYDKDLHLKNAPFIWIIDASYGESFKELESDLMPNMGIEVL